jgi:hypothetical protein
VTAASDLGTYYEAMTLRARRLALWILLFLGLAWLAWMILGDNVISRHPTAISTEGGATTIEKPVPTGNDIRDALSPSRNEEGPSHRLKNQTLARVTNSDAFKLALYRARVSNAVEREYRLNPLDSGQTSVILTGQRYQLVRFVVAGDVAHAVYDTVNGSITSLAPVGDYMVTTPSGDTVLFIEPDRLLAYSRGDEIIREVAGSYLLPADSGETYSRVEGAYVSPIILDLRDDSITLQSFRHVDALGTRIDPPELRRTQRLNVP